MKEHREKTDRRGPHSDGGHSRCGDNWLSAGDGKERNTRKVIKNTIEFKINANAARYRNGGESESGREPRILNSNYQLTTLNLFSYH